MARAKALPTTRRVHPRYLTPSTSTHWMGVLSIVWYVGLTLVSENILYDSIAALGLMIAFYYGLTGFACVFYRREHEEAQVFLLVGVAPAARRADADLRLRQVGHRPLGPANSSPATRGSGSARRS